MNKILNEGGNIFKGPSGGSETIRIKREDVDPTLEWLEGILGIDLVDFKLGTTGRKETSGDLDIAIDKDKVSKDDLIKKLMAWVNENHPELDLANSDEKEMKQMVLFRQTLCSAIQSSCFGQSKVKWDQASIVVATDRT